MKNQYLHGLNDDTHFLIGRLHNGEEAAYEVLFNEYYKVLTIFANKYLRDIEASKELVQDLFVHLYERRENLDINSSLKSYLFRSTHNRCINLLNAQKIRLKYAEHMNFIADVKDNSLENQVNSIELEHAIYKAISDLPPKCRSIFKMNRFEGLSNTEIADKLKLSKRTVETQISKALKILRIKLEPYMVAGSILIWIGFIRLMIHLNVI
jgi:RNA polymerase sigma-70 factor (family 1)